MSRFYNKVIFILYKNYITTKKNKNMRTRVKRAKMCVYLDVELSDWIKTHAIHEYRSFSSFLNKLMLDHKTYVESTSNIELLKTETKS